MFVSVDVVGDGCKAVEAAQNVDYDLILMDIMVGMPYLTILPIYCRCQIWMD
jgi:CheY-like chemotaxis protein